MAAYQEEHHHSTNGHSHNGHRHTQELRREIESTRANLDSTISELKSATAPGALFEEAIGLLEGGPGEFLKNLGRTARDNPVPTLLLGIGTAWLAASTRTRDSYAEIDEYEPVDEYDVLDDEFRLAEGESLDDALFDTPGGTYGAPSEIHTIDVAGENKLSQAKAGAASMGTKAKQAVSSVGGRASGMGAGVKAKAAGLAHGARDKASSLGAGAKSAATRVSTGARSGASAVGQRARSGASAVGRGARSGMQRASATGQAVGRNARKASVVARDQFSRQMEENPLILGAVGVGLGALLGGLLPRTHREDRAMGHRAGRLKGNVRSEVSTHVEQFKAAGRSGKEAASETVRGGAQDLQQPLRDAIHRTESDARNVGRRAVEELEHAMHRSKDAVIERMRQAAPHGGAEPVGSGEEGRSPAPGTFQPPGQPFTAGPSSATTTTVRTEASSIEVTEHEPKSKVDVRS